MKKAINILALAIGVFFLTSTVSLAEIAMGTTSVEFQEFKAGKRSVVDFEVIYSVIHEQRSKKWFPNEKNRITKLSIYLENADAEEGEKKDKFISIYSEIHLWSTTTDTIEKGKSLIFPIHISERFLKLFPDEKPGKYLELIFNTKKDLEKFKKILLHEPQKRPEKKQISFKDYIKDQQ